jgi:uracil-DNA glycosylase
LVKPKFIIALGNEAMSLVSPYGSGIFRRVGEILEKPTGLIGEVDAYVAIMPHPSTILRSGSRMSDWEFGAGKIKEFLDKKRGK